MVGVGKVGDLFAHRGFTRLVKARGNAEGMARFADLLRGGESPGLHFINLVDFDMLWGHRNDPEGYAEGLRVFDVWLGDFLAGLGPDDRLLITADHGNDPTTPGTDHTREWVPVLAARPGLAGAVDLGRRETFADLAATAAEAFGLGAFGPGRSFWRELEEG